MFTPWIGSLYGQPANSIGGLRLMIVGESHYPEKQNIDKWVGKTYAEQTIEVIRADAIEKPYKFFTKLAHLSTGEDVEAWPLERRSNFWNAIVFYNFVPVFVLPRSENGRPTTSEFKAGREPFAKVVADLDPQVLIVVGLTLWWWVMDSLPGGEKANSSRPDTAKIGNGYGLRVPHVTGAIGADRYQYEVSRPLLNTLIESALK